MWGSKGVLICGVLLIIQGVLIFGVLLIVQGS